MVVFWIWFALAVAVYGYRVWRRVTKGPKREREARQLAEEGRAAGLGERLGRKGLPPLPDGPLEPRLPRALQDRPPAGGGPASSPAGAPSPSAGPAARAIRTPVPSVGVPAPAPDAPAPAPPIAAPTVAEALRGIDLPCELVPVVETDDPAVVSGHRVVFSTRTATFRAVAAGLADELERLGYNVADTPADTDGRLLTATRGAVVVAARVTADEAGAVTADVTT